METGMAYAQPTPAVDHKHESDGEHHEHPTELKYIKIAAILAFITLAEVAIYYIDAFSGVLVPMLIVMSAFKFVMVVGYFMHLKFDDKRLAWIFTGGMLTALAVFIATWALMHYHEIAEYFSNML
jgi:cytochrome c oxidase subunit 4